jgi:hypothetical protein
MKGGKGRMRMEEEDRLEKEIAGPDVYVVLGG